MELNEVIRFLVTIIRTMKEKVIAIAIPCMADVTKAFSTSIEVQALHVCLPLTMFGAESLALVFISVMYSSQRVKYGALISPGTQAATTVLT